MAIRRLFTRLRERHGVTATIQRGAVVGDEITLTELGIGSQVVRSRDAAIESERQDFQIAASDYAPTGEASEPEVGDVITVEEATVTRQFRVLVPTDGDRCFRFQNAAQTELRVHTKLMSESGTL
jgi:hypothetical protein